MQQPHLLDHLSLNGLVHMLMLATSPERISDTLLVGPVAKAARRLEPDFSPVVTHNLGCAPVDRSPGMRIFRQSAASVARPGLEAERNRNPCLRFQFGSFPDLVQQKASS